VDRDSSGRVLSAIGLGETPIGYLIYDAAGHVAAQLSARERPRTVCDTAPGVTGPNNNANIAGYSAYFGHYEIDPRKGTVTHYLEGTLSPADVGKRLVRRFRLVGDTLTIEFEPDTNRTRRLVWHRVSR
jgi:hypothetical protein